MSSYPAATPATAVLDDATDAHLLDLAEQAVITRRLAEVAELRLAYQWATRNGHPEHDRDPMSQPGGEGTPEMRQYAVPDLAAARMTHPATTRALIADALDLVHRLPRTWSLLQTGAAEPWVARRAATQTRHLDPAQAAAVDTAVAAVAGGHSPATVLETLTASIMKVDAAGLLTRRETDRHRRYATLSRADEHGYRHLIARVTTGDAAWLDAMLDRVADILAGTHGHDHNHHELRSLALGWLARPADLLKLLLDHTLVPDADTTDEEWIPPAPHGEGPLHRLEHIDDPDVSPPDQAHQCPHSGRDQREQTDEPTDPEPEEPSQTRRPAWVPAHLDATLARLAALTPRQLTALRGHACLYLHLDESALRRHDALARVEGLGPHWVSALTELIGHADVRLTPVVDLHTRARTERYEHTESLKDQVWLTAGGDAWPWSPRTAVRDRVDFDHVHPWDPHSPPGQTGTHNSAPLRRRHHRWKTHAGWTGRHAGPGRYLWRSRHDRTYLVDHHGTRRLHPHDADLITNAPPGIDLYPTDIVIEYRC